ncbi:general substrate transporter [Lentinula edodes]|uniref:General substrate transporter n=1 Tax=Lentinula lateritia TaxID=40482 RepID=A0A9W9AZX0_9AGAR|nr:general substrate transporter [Lentinula edodes]
MSDIDRPTDDIELLHELEEIEAAIEEEREARKGLGWNEAFFGKGNLIRFVIASVIFLLQQWCGQNFVGYYAPQIFASIGYTVNKNSLLASGVYGVVKLVATSIFIFIFFGVETLSRKLHLFLIGAMMKTHALPATSSTSVVTAISPASQGMAAMLYIYVCFYSMGWGPLPWVYVSDIFPIRTRHYGLAVASASQWLWIASLLISRHQFHLTFFCRQDFVVSHQTLLIEQHLGFKFFLMFATINIGAMGTFSLLIPETKGRSLEEMDIIFGSVSAEKRSADVAKFEHALDNGPEISSTRSNDYGDTKA